MLTIDKCISASHRNYVHKFILMIRRVVLQSVGQIYLNVQVEEFLSMEALKGHVKFLKTVCVSPNWELGFS